MARSPLFRSLQGALRRALALRQARLPLDELLEGESRARLTRREFLVRGAGVAGALAVAGAAGGLARALPAGAAGAEVVIVGGGIAGLTAAWRLRQAGVPARVLEAQNRTGGRMLSLRGFFADGQVCELGGELIDTGHTRIQALAAELDILLDDLAAEEPGLRLGTYEIGGQLRGAAELVAAAAPLAARIEADRAALGDTELVAGAEGTARRLDTLSLAAYLDQAGLDDWFRKLMGVAYTTEFGMECDEQSALNLITMMGTEPGAFEQFGESDERFHVKGGNDWIVRTLADRLADSIALDTALEAVRVGPDGRYVCSVRGRSGSREVRATHLLLALPFTLLRTVRLDVELPPVKRLCIDTLGYGTNAKLMVGFAERTWRVRHGADGSVFTDRPMQSSWETSRAQAGAAGILTNFTGGRHGVELGVGTPAEQAARMTADLDALFPGSAAARAGMKEARFHWPTNPWVKGSYAGYRVGQWTSIGGAEAAPVGRLYFAGEHCSREAQGFMEGGCATGEEAAAAILQDLS